MNRCNTNNVLYKSESEEAKDMSKILDIVGSAAEVDP